MFHRHRVSQESCAPVTRGNFPHFLNKTGVCTATTSSTSSEMWFESIMAITNFGNFGNGTEAVPLLNRNMEQQPEHRIVLQPKQLKHFVPCSGSFCGFELTVINGSTLGFERALHYTSAVKGLPRNAVGRHLVTSRHPFSQCLCGWCRGYGGYPSFFCARGNRSSNMALRSSKLLARSSKLLARSSKNLLRSSTNLHYLHYFHRRSGITCSLCQVWTLYPALKGARSSGGLFLI